MAALLEAALRSYIREFVKSSPGRQLDLNLFRGEINLSNTELNEHAIQYLLGLPATLEIVRVSCGGLRVRVPWRSLKRDPPSVSLSDVVVSIRECADPAAATGPTPFLKRLFEKAQAPPQQQQQQQQQQPQAQDKAPPATRKRGFADAMMEDACVEIKNVKFIFSSADGSTVATFDLVSLGVRTTGSSWEAVDLQAARQSRVVAGEAHIYKEARVGSMDLTVNEQPVVQIPPFNVHVLVKRDAVSGELLGIQGSIVMPALVIMWTNPSWSATLTLIETLSKIATDTKPAAAAAAGAGAAAKDKDVAMPHRDRRDSLKGPRREDSVSDTDQSVGDIGVSEAEVEELARQLGTSSSAERRADMLSDRSITAARFEKQLLQLDFELEGAQMSWGGVVSMDIKRIAVTVMANLSSKSRSSTDSAAASSCLNILARAVIEKVSASIGTNGPNTEVLGPLLGDSSVSNEPFVFATVSLKKDLGEEPRMYDLDVAARVHGLKLAVEAVQVDRAIEFFSKRMLALPPAKQPAQQGPPPDLSFLNSTRATVVIGGLQATLHPNFVPGAAGSSISVGFSEVEVNMVPQSAPSGFDDTAHEITLSLKKLGAAQTLQGQAVDVLSPLDIEARLIVRQLPDIAQALGLLEQNALNISLPSSLDNLPSVTGKVTIGALDLNLSHKRLCQLFTTLRQHQTWSLGAFRALEKLDLMRWKRAFRVEDLSKQVASVLKMSLQSDVVLGGIKVQAAVPPAVLLALFENMERAVKESKPLAPVLLGFLDERSAVGTEKRMLLLSTGVIDSTLRHIPSITPSVLALASESAASFTLLGLDAFLRDLTVDVPKVPFLGMGGAVTPRKLDTPQGDAVACGLRCKLDINALWDHGKERRGVQHKVVAVANGLDIGALGTVSERFIAFTESAKPKPTPAAATPAAPVVEPMFDISIDVGEIHAKHVENELRSLAIRMATDGVRSSRELALEHQIKLMDEQAAVAEQDHQKSVKKFREELADLEAKLIQSKLSEANALTVAGEKEMTAASLKQQNEKLRSEKDRAYELLKTCKGGSAVDEFKRISDTLGSDLSAAETKSTRLTAELERVSSALAAEQAQRKEAVEALKKAQETGGDEKKQVFQLQDALREQEALVAAERAKASEQQQEMDKLRQQLAEAEKKTEEARKTADQNAELLNAMIERLNQEILKNAHESTGSTGKLGMFSLGRRNSVSQTQRPPSARSAELSAHRLTPHPK
eukprot:m51a1_g3382 hypothetical protein (1231) ;mRNA; r:490503-494788